MDVLMSETKGQMRITQRLLTLCLLLLPWLCGQRIAAQSSAIPEYRVKATFLFQFTQFVDWPRDAFSSPQTPLVIGIFGEDPFGSFLDDTVRDEKANGHPLAVERYRKLDDINNCHVLFVSRSEATRITDIVAALKGRRTLVVGDINGFADRGGMIQFVTEENKIHLRINLAATKAANLTISSKLLRPATVINSGAD
jgi:YfiR/HmsC-like